MPENEAVRERFELLRIARISFSVLQQTSPIYGCMTNEQINSWAITFADALTAGGERVPLDRVIREHLPTIMKLRTDMKLTWRAIASIMTRGGARRRDGRPISFDQLRADATRLNRRTAAATLPEPYTPPSSQTSRERDRGAKRSKRTGSPPQRDKESVPAAVSNQRTLTSKDISSGDVAAAMALIRK
jgi:hypothetical protein